MSEITLPDGLFGNWIWSEPSILPYRDSHVFFRREFSLNEAPGLAEMWISCHSHFNIYINEQHLSFGPSPSIKSYTYVQYFNITHLLQTGKNLISIQCNNPRISRFSNTKHDDGLWAQVNIDDTTEFATDDSWKVSSANHMLPNQFRISSAHGFVETQDLRKYNTKWNTLTDSSESHDLQITNSNTWAEPFILKGIDPSELLPLNLPEFTSSELIYKHISARGQAIPRSASISVEFNQIITEPGTYVAHSYFFSEEAFQEELFIHSDDSYKIFINGQPTNSQGDKRSLNGADPDWLKPMTCLEGNESNSHCSAVINEGWNDIIIIYYGDHNSAGITVNFNSFPASAMHMVQEPAEEPTLGWKLAGPLKIPFSHISGMLNFDQMEQVAYHNLRPCDASAYLMSLDFSPSSTEETPVGFLELESSEYVILDLGKCVTGTPLLTIAGTSGDIVDVVYAELSIDGKVLPLHSNHGRQTDTIILSDDELVWSSQNPRAFRYLCIHIRDSKESCFIKDPAVRIIGVEDDLKGKFQCNDETVNSIFQVGVQTLESCSQYNFVDSPAGDNCQYIADAAIQGITSLQTLGTPQLSRKALIEFAQQQFETGEMPGACPSDIYFNIPDYPLHWVKWLQKHILYTDDRELMEECLPALGHLMDYYNSLALPDFDVLGGNLGELCFLDHEDIDRRGIVTGLNALYCRALHSAAWIFDYADIPESATTVRARAKHVAKTMRDLCWDEERGLFADCYVNGQKSDSYGLHSNILAMYGSLPTSQDYNRIFENLFLEESPYFKLPTTNLLNPFFNYFVLETAFGLNKREWAIDFIRWYWGGMAQAGASTWWEFYNPTLNTSPTLSSSLCHGYGVAPNIYVFTDIAGIRPAAPGYKQVYFNPLPGPIDWVKSKIPTPHGYISVDWITNREGGLDIEIKANYEVDVISQIPADLVAISTVHVSEEVNIISDLE
ncbi:MAG: glycoside hydrolase family 78 protein [Lentisphaeraceae bacterium]|nr:glycoside hydrolase family 78 protein [Lentisphaeraceae bacterium]